MPPQDAGKRLLLGQGHGDATGGGMLPLLPGGWQSKKKGMNRYVFLLGILLLVLLTTLAPAALALNGNSIGQQLATAIKNVIIEIFNILTPIINVIGIGMVLVGLLLGLGLRQEFLGFRLAIGGGLALLTVHVIVPMLLQYI
jgi:mannose/fructose/N-acetylgalactosamine-specific phosphotransferase system component IIC